MATILIVEDDPWLADCYQQWLQKAGHRTWCVNTAQAAINALDDAKVDIILLDMFLPQANGVQLLHEMRSHADLMRLPVIICSTAQIPPLPAYGVAATLAKASLTPQQLRQTITQVLANATI